MISRYRVLKSLRLASLYRVLILCCLLMPLGLGLAPRPSPYIQTPSGWGYDGEATVFCDSHPLDECTVEIIDLYNAHVTWSWNGTSPEPHLLFHLGIDNQSYTISDIEFCLSGSYPLAAGLSEPRDLKLTNGGLGVQSVAVGGCFSDWNDTPGLVTTAFVNEWAIFPTGPESGVYDFILTITTIDGIPVVNTPTPTSTPGNTSVAQPCFPTFTPVASFPTATATNFGASTSTPNATPSTLTPFPTFAVPGAGLGVTEGFATQVGATWQAEGTGWDWGGSDFGHNGPGSMRGDLSIDRTTIYTGTRLVYSQHIDSDWYLEFWYFTNGVSIFDPAALFSLDLYTWSAGNWLPLGGGQYNVLVFTPEDNNIWRLARVNQNPNAADAVALMLQDTLNFTVGSYVWVDDFTWRSRGFGGGGSGDCGPGGTPAPLPTTIFEPPCDQGVLDVCIGPIDDTTDICLGWEGFTITIPGVDEYLIYGVLVCLVPYAVTSLSIAGQDMMWIAIAALTALPGILLFQMVRTAR